MGIERSAVFVVSIVIAGAGCQSRSLAIDVLERDGMTDIELTKNDAGIFDFVAKHKAKRQICKGSVSATSYGFKSESTLNSYCEPDESECPADPVRCWELGDVASKKDPEKAVQLYSKGCLAGNGPSCTNLGVAYEDGKGTEANLAQAMETWEKGCKLGAAKSCMNAAGKLDGGKVKADPARLATLLSSACALKEDRGCFYFALKQFNGEGVEKNEAEAGKTIQGLCNTGFQEACGPLGYFLFTGAAGLSKDRDQGRAMMIAACEKDDAEACANLAVFSREGALPPDVMARAGAFAESACNKDNVNGCLELGLLLEQGKGGKPRDLPAAFAMHQKACTLGAGVGCANVGLMLARGTGTARDLDASNAAYDKACALGYQPACKP